MKQCTLLITGGAGFIGSHFVRHILQYIPSIQVKVLDKLTYAGNLRNIETSLKHASVSFIHGDICDAAVVQAAMNGCDVVVNFAAETHVDRSIVSPGAFIRTNVEGTFTLLETALRLGIKLFMQVSTDEVYGDIEAPDSVKRPSVESDRLAPLSPYAATKASADLLALSYWSTFGLPVVITRCSNNYGPHQYPEKQLPLFITNALAGRPLPVYNDGRNVRDWIYVEDHCVALQTLLSAPVDRVAGEIFNIGANEERSILDNAYAILEALSLPSTLITFVPDRLGHVRRHAINAHKIQSAFAWSPKVRFQEGLLYTLAWYKEHHEWLDEVLKRRDTFLEDAFQLRSV